MAQAKVKDLAEYFVKLVELGKGEYDVAVNDNCGGCYSLSKFDGLNSLGLNEGIGVTYDSIKNFTIGD